MRVEIHVKKAPLGDAGIETASRLDEILVKTLGLEAIETLFVESAGFERELSSTGIVDNAVVGNGNRILLSMLADSRAAPLRPCLDETTGTSSVHGRSSRFSDDNAYQMMLCAVDDAYRAHIALGAMLESAKLHCFRFWPDCARSTGGGFDEKLLIARFTEACRGLRDASLMYGTSLDSSQDCLIDDTGFYVGIDTPYLKTMLTLAGTGMEAKKRVLPYFVEAGNLVYILGDTNGELVCTLYERIHGCVPFGTAPTLEPERVIPLYRALRRAISGRIVQSARGCSEGGIAMALYSSCFGGQFGARISLDDIPGTAAGSAANSPLGAAQCLFSESPGRLIVSIRDSDRERFEATMHGTAFRFVGEITADARIAIDLAKRRIVDLSFEGKPMAPAG